MGGKSIKVTRDHSLFYSEESSVSSHRTVPAFQERLPKRVVTTAVQDFEQNQESFVDDKMLTLFGLWLGDGCYQDNRLNIATGNDLATVKFLSELPRYFDNLREGMDNRGRVQLTENYRLDVSPGKCVRFGNTRLAQYMQMAGFTGNSHTKRVPNWIFTLGQGRIGLFLPKDTLLPMEAFTSIRKRGQPKSCWTIALLQSRLARRYPDTA